MVPLLKIRDQGENPCKAGFFKLHIPFTLGREGEGKDKATHFKPTKGSTSLQL